MNSSPSLDNLVREQLDKLESQCPSLISCRVVVTAPTEHHNSGGHYKVTVDLMVPGQEIVADRDPGERDTHEDCKTAIRDAFRAARKEVSRYQSRQADHRR